MTPCRRIRRFKRIMEHRHREKLMDDDGMSHEETLKDFKPVAGQKIVLGFPGFPDLKSEAPGDEVEVILRGKVSEVHQDGVDIIPGEASLIHGKTDDRKWIAGAVKHKGALRAAAKRRGLLDDDDDTLSKKDLFSMESSAKKSGDVKLLKRVRLARTLMQMRR